MTVYGRDVSKDLDVVIDPMNSWRNWFTSEYLEDSELKSALLDMVNEELPLAEQHSYSDFSSPGAIVPYILTPSDVLNTTVSSLERVDGGLLQTEFSLSLDKSNCVMADNGYNYTNARLAIIKVFNEAYFYLIFLFDGTHQEVSPNVFKLSIEIIPAKVAVDNLTNNVLTFTLELTSEMLQKMEEAVYCDLDVSDYDDIYGDIYVTIESPNYFYNL